MDGQPITTYMKNKDKTSDKLREFKMKLSDLGARLILKMVFFDNFIHADLHPGKEMIYNSLLFQFCLVYHLIM